MTQPKIKVHGLPELKATMRKAAAEMQEMKDAHLKAAQLVAAAGRGTAPRRTGRLSASVSGDRESAKAVIVATAPYAAFVHYGTRYMAARPWLLRTAEQTQAQWLPIYERELQQILDKVRGD